jgi:hypothetical protein
MNILAPLICQSSPTRTARVDSAAASDPVSGSVSAKQASASPAHNRGSHFDYLPPEDRRDPIHYPGKTSSVSFMVTPAPEAAGMVGPPRQRGDSVSQQIERVIGAARSEHVAARSEHVAARSEHVAARGEAAA